jgi:hypothetical protein
MTKTVLGLFGMLAIVLPQFAGAQETNEGFRASYQYPAKYLCGHASGSDSRLGVVYGHYNTIVNVLALRDDTKIGLRATMVSTDLEIDEGEPSQFVRADNLDSDEAMGIDCAAIKRWIFDSCCEGFMDGFVMIYRSKPLVVSDVVTAENYGEEGGGAGHSMQIFPVREMRSRARVTPRSEEP